MSSKQNLGYLPINARAEGCLVVVTDFDTVSVSDETWRLCLGLYEGRRLSKATINRRAIDAAIAIATYVAKKAWEKGDGAPVI